MIGQCESAIEHDAILQHAWLTDVLTRLPEWPEDRLAELLPLEGFTFSGGHNACRQVFVHRAMACCRALSA